MVACNSMTSFDTMLIAVYMDILNDIYLLSNKIQLRYFSFKPSAVQLSQRCSMDFSIVRQYLLPSFCCLEVPFIIGFAVALIGQW